MKFNNINSKFGERVKKLRIENNLSQEKLAQALSVTRSAVNDWENRDTETNFVTLIKIAQFFNVTTDYLLGLVDEIQ